MKISLKKGQTVWLRVQAPKSGEIFTVPLELEEDSLSGYTNIDSEQLMEQTRKEIHAAAERLKNSENYASDEGYSNLAAEKFDIGQNEVKRQKQRGFV